MICDKIEKLNHYAAFCPDFAAISEYLSKNDAASLKPGRYEINDDVFVNVEEYAPGDNSVYEFHRDRIDVQYLVTGDEEILCAPLSDVVTEKEYDAGIDAGFGKEKKDASVFILHMRSGTFAVFEPDDAHCPGRKLDAGFVKKLIFKIKVR
jgi:YhcH/YjgK/YiaL family protein